MSTSNSSSVKSRTDSHEADHRLEQVTNINSNPGAEAGHQPSSKLRETGKVMNTNVGRNENPFSVFLVDYSLNNSGCTLTWGKFPKALRSARKYPNLLVIETDSSVNRLRPSWNDSRNKMSVVGWFIVETELDVNQAAGTDYPPDIPQFSTMEATVWLRGNVPPPTTNPTQIVFGGFEGLLKAIESMWPNAPRFLVSELNQAPKGWELYREHPVARD